MPSSAINNREGECVMNKKTEGFIHMLQEVGGTKLVIEVEKGNVNPFHLVHEPIEKR
jgi:hypothetical protein